MSGKKAPELALAAAPRVDLLPPEIRTANRGKVVVRVMVLAVIAVLALVAAGVGYATLQAMGSQALLAQERGRTEDLLARQMEFAEARAASKAVAQARVARVAAAATEIDWRAYLAEVQATLPAGVSLTRLSVDSISPTEPIPVPDVPLQEDWVASISIEAMSTTVPDVESWLRDLEGLTGFAGVAPPVSVTGGDGEGYRVAIDVRVGADAFALRFDDEEVD